MAKHHWALDFKKYLKESCRRIPKDKPLIISLSGGVDSSMILFTLLEIGRRPDAAITYQLGNKETSDLYYSELIADTYKIPHYIAKVPIQSKRELSNDGCFRYQQKGWRLEDFYTCHVTRDISPNYKSNYYGGSLNLRLSIEETT